MSTESRASLATRFEDIAAQALNDARGGRSSGAPQLIAVAQAAAILALTQRVAALTEKLGEYLGDDSHLDGLGVVVREGLAGLEDRLAEINSGVRR